MEVSIVALVMRWFHIIGALILVGGTLYLYFGLRGALDTLEGETREAFRTKAMKGWKHFVALALVLLIVSGFYNYLVVLAPAHEDQPLYHALFGVKFLLALVAFGLVFVVTSTMKWSEKLRDKPLMWHLAVLTGLAVVLIAGYMKLMPTN